VIPGTGRIIQLRMLARRHRGLDAKRAASTHKVSTTPSHSGEPGQS
jgi:hypothetical protein